MNTLLQENAPSVQTAKAPGPEVGRTEIRIKGKPVLVPSVNIEGRNVVVTGKWIRNASIQDEDLWEGESVPDPGSFISQLKKGKLGCDIFTFSQRIPDIERRYDFYTEWDNAAALPITTYQHWFKNCAEYSIRKAVNKAGKCGVVAKTVDFSDEFVAGVCRIYTESPTRQGRTFWHYNKDFETVKHELATYLDRSVFLGAFFEDRLIGSMKITYVGSTAPIMQIFCSQHHFDKRPNNALIAKAVEVCERDGKSHLIYGSFVYHEVNSTLTEFKRRNGFEAVRLPRYYVPLTVKGAMALKCGLHRGLVGSIPPALLTKYRNLRHAWYARRQKRVQ